MRETTPNLLTYEDAARVLGITHGSLKQAIIRGNLHPVKLPGSRNKFLRRDELEQYRAVRPVRPRRTYAAVPAGADLRTLIDAEHAAAYASQEEALALLRALVNATSTAWLANATASKGIAEANQRAAEANQRAAETMAAALQHVAEATVSSERAITANAASIRDTLIEALRLYLPLLQRGRLLSLPASDQDEQAQRTTQDDGRGTDVKPQVPSARRAGKQSIAALAEKLLATGGSGPYSEY